MPSSYRFNTIRQAILAVDRSDRDFVIHSPEGNLRGRFNGNCWYALYEGSQQLCEYKPRQDFLDWFNRKHAFKFLPSYYKSRFKDA